MAGNGGRDWATEALDYVQSTSSRGYSLGARVGAMTPKVAKKYLQEREVEVIHDCWVARACGIPDGAT